MVIGQWLYQTACTLPVLNTARSFSQLDALWSNVIQIAAIKLRQGTQSSHSAYFPCADIAQAHRAPSRCEGTTDLNHLWRSSVSYLMLCHPAGRHFTLHNSALFQFSYPCMLLKLTQVINCDNRLVQYWVEKVQRLRNSFLLLPKASNRRVRATMRGWTHLTFLQASASELVTLSFFYKQ